MLKSDDFIDPAAGKAYSKLLAKQICDVIDIWEKKLPERDFLARVTFLKSYLEYLHYERTGLFPFERPYCCCSKEVNSDKGAKRQ